MPQFIAHELGYVWPGLPVTCMVCLQGCDPTYRVTEERCGFVMPDHDGNYGRPGGPDHQTCPGSGAPVQKPVHATMARRIEMARIEKHVVSAMPAAHVSPCERRED